MSKPTKDEERYSVICQHCGKGFKAITVSHLRRVHKYAGEHPILDYKRKFRRRWAHCGETLAKMRVHSKRRHDEWAATWSEERILAAIRTRFQQVEAGQTYEFELELVRAARLQFGSWDAAVRRAGLKYEELTGRRHWSPAKVLKEIRLLARQRREHGTTAPKRLLEAAERSFGNWEAAVQAAGLDYKQFTKREIWTAERVKAAIRKRAKVQKRGAGRVPRGLWCAARRHFGSYRAAAKAAGVDFDTLSGSRTWSRDAVIAEICQLAERRRYEPMGTPPILREAALRHFESWDDAVQAAGLDPTAFRRLRWVRQGNGK